MIDNFSKKSKLIPVFFLILVTALGVKVVNVKSGFDLLVTDAIAAEPITSPAIQEAEPQDQDNKVDVPTNTGQSLASGVDDIEIYSSEVEDILFQFKEQRSKLNAREKVLYDLQATMFKAAETKINNQITELKAIEEELRRLLSLYTENEEKQLGRIVKMYETMKDKDAAPRFEQLELPVQIDLAMRIKEKNMAAILAKMSLPAAQTLTNALAIRTDTPTIASLKQSVTRN